MKYFLLQPSQTCNEDRSDSIKGTRSLSPNQKGRNTSSEDKLDSYTERDSKETKYSTSKTSMEEKLGSFDETVTPHHGSAQISSEDVNIGFVIDRLVGDEQTAKETQYHVRYDRYDAKGNTFGQESLILTHFITGYWLENVIKCRKRRERRPSN